MVARKESKPTSGTEGLNSSANQLEKLTRLLALLVVKGESQVEKIKVLAGAGFASGEIAELLGTTSNTVSVTLSKLRSKK